MFLHADEIFAPLDRDLHMERIAGGNETEVYLSDDRRFVVKVKSDGSSTVGEALARARTMRAASEEVIAILGPEYSIPSHYLIARDSAGQIQVIVVQPFITGAQPLFEVDYTRLSPEERGRITTQLQDIIRRSRDAYRRLGRMPDLYGRVSRSHAERRRLNAPHMLLWRIWSFLVRRNLLRSHNLVLTEAPERRIVLVDYDPVQRSRLYQTIYYKVRQFLFWRDELLLLGLRLRDKLAAAATSIGLH